MDIKEFLDFLISYRDTEISFIHVFIAIGITAVFLLGLHLFRYFVTKREVYFNILDILIKIGLAGLIEFLIIWIFGARVFLISILIGILAAVYIRNKYFDFLDKSIVANEDIKERLELNELEKKFKKTPNYSILEVLLYYGYISKLHKDFIESENIFETPEEMAEKLLSTPVITEQQLKEAKAIMNVIRREGHVVTRQEALLLISKIEERSNSINEENKNK